MADPITIEDIQEIDRSSWEKLKLALLEIPYCVSCGMNYKVLVEDISKLLK